MILRGTLVIAAFLGAAPGWAADYSDPTWPCVQRKVERLSVGLMWPQPIPETAPEDASVRRDIHDLATRLAVRRIPVEEIRADVAGFAESHQGDPALLGLVFDDVFGSLSGRRTQIISGIGKFSLSQIALSERIEAARKEMDAEMAKDEPDFDRVDALEEQLDWDQTIYSDRQQSITYLCETPVLLEKRLFEIAQMLQAEAQGG
ncbi:hypothetical protein [Ponticoccus alexandrii]|uniref:Uncharacterized protein n=1 Tax=Ponticoccus alexandrii TaxID=1943633 RepID=A0ABX7F365_9RHOB|nr:hypothetical protein [Ponticoccus alexandrii]ETA53580.1 hypothetical protein P279_02465 [Rhodobacteraceae bacterium PD-2]QRF64909.1 hypothetical protein GQA70_00425 [Ponticoccus alexandrii]